MLELTSSAALKYLAHGEGASAAQQIGTIDLFSCLSPCYRQRPPGHISRFALEEIGHKGLVLVFFFAVSKDVSALNCLWVEAEVVVDGEDSGGSIGETRDACSAYVLERVVCYKEASEETNVSTGHQGQCIYLLARSPCDKGKDSV
jgi:hypothetical protein